MLFVSPLSAGSVVALWTVSVSTAVVQRYLSFAVVAFISQPAERRGMATQQVIADLESVAIEFVTLSIVGQMLLQQGL